MKRRLLVIVATLGLLLVSAPSAFAYTQGSCPADDNMKVRLWENVVGDASDNNDTLWRCSSSVSDLGAVAHTLAGGCKAAVKIFDTWDDCVSSFTPYIPAGYTLCLYTGVNYTGFHSSRLQANWSGGHWDTSKFGISSDTLTSYRFDHFTNNISC